MKRDLFQVVRGKADQRIARVDENDEIRRIVGRRLKLARELNGWTQEVAAAKLDYVSSTQLSLAEKGTRLPPIVKLIKAAEVFGVSIDYILGICDEPERDPRAAERQAALRHVSGVMEATSRTIVTAVLTHQSVAPSVSATKKLAALADNAIKAVENLRASNLAVFDAELRGAATVLRTIEELQAAVQQAKDLINRHDQVTETAFRTMDERIGIARPLFDQDNESTTGHGTVK